MGNFTANREEILLDSAVNQLKWQHCWPQSYAFSYVPVQKESNKNFCTQTAFNWKPLLTTYGKFSKILIS